MFVLKIICGVALMMQSYLVTEDDNKRLNSNKDVFEWLVTVLDLAIQGRRWRGYGFAVIEIVEVRYSNRALCVIPGAVVYELTRSLCVIPGVEKCLVASPVLTVSASGTPVLRSGRIIFASPSQQDIQCRTVLLSFSVLLLAVVIPGELRRYHAKCAVK